MPPGIQRLPEEAACRECGGGVLTTDLECPHCRALRPGVEALAAEGYEWKTAATWMGVPVVHIAFGYDRLGQVRTARGVIAIGQRAVGAVAIGLMACGFVSIGLCSLGIVSVGVAALGLLLGMGVNAAGCYAIGVVALGYAVGGVAPLGWEILFSVSR